MRRHALLGIWVLLSIVWTALILGLYIHAESGRRDTLQTIPSLRVSDGGSGTLVPDRVDLADRVVYLPSVLPAWLVNKLWEVEGDLSRLPASDYVQIQKSVASWKVFEKRLPDYSRMRVMAPTEQAAELAVAAHWRSLGGWSAHRWTRWLLIAVVPPLVLLGLAYGVLKVREGLGRAA